VKKIKIVALSLTLMMFLMESCIAQSAETENILPPKREFRAVWIATVDNIDWPSSKNLEPEEQQEEFSALLDFHKRVGMNAVFVQVRAAGDAFYAKSPEPWSEWLTGRQGRQPDPMWDPLDFMIEGGTQTRLGISRLAESEQIGSQIFYEHFFREHQQAAS
jgi:uncharacterized lipoprotein YddW (UPF0748 family)